MNVSFYSRVLVLGLEYSSAPFILIVEDVVNHHVCVCIMKFDHLTQADLSGGAEYLIVAVQGELGLAQPKPEGKALGVESFVF